MPLRQISPLILRLLALMLGLAAASGQSPGIPDGPPRRDMDQRPAPRGMPGGSRVSLAGYDPQTANFQAAWPETSVLRANAVTKVIEETPAASRFIYESQHFRIQSDVAIQPGHLTKVATLLETCHLAHHDIPLNNRRTRSPAAPKLKIRLFSTMEGYSRAGTPPGTVGAYLGRSDELVVTLESIGLKSMSTGYVFDPFSDFHVLFHEITHLLWADLGFRIDPWMTEGFAEYLGCVAYRDGRISFARLPEATLEFATAHGEKGSKGGRALGKDIVMPALSELMSWSQETFYRNPNQNYGYALLLVHHFLLLDGKGDGAKFKAYLQALQSGRSAEEAKKLLLDADGYEGLERTFAAAMLRKGIRISFR